MCASKKKKIGNSYYHLMVKVVMRWTNLYTSLCDSVKFVTPKELPLDSISFYVLSKGVESVEKDEGEKLCMFLVFIFTTSSISYVSKQMYITQTHTPKRRINGLGI